MIQSHRNDIEPWYVRKKKYQPQNFLHKPSKPGLNEELDKKQQIKRSIFLFVCIFFIMITAISSGVFITLAIFEKSILSNTTIFIVCALALFFVSIGLMILLIGFVCANILKNNSINKFSYAVQFLKGQLHIEEPRKGIPAPEMALYQFIQQVRAYAMEKSFLKQKQDRQQDAFIGLNGVDPNSLLKRRWNDVVDSLNEFEIYLANDPKGMIEKLVVKSPPQNMDVSQIFRDVAETFDTTWRRKGINIEHAIVTPLKANTNEALLRRLLVGPWRSCVYFARRGNGVVFSAKSIDGKIITRWECEGMAFPEEFFALVKNNELDVNDRIEKGMAMIALDPNSPNTLFALISFVTWIDLVHVAQCDYEIKQGSEGLIIELRL
ncbi:hypothetical protein ACWNT8_08320 [Pigmentibacter ruber]